VAILNAHPFERAPDRVERARAWQTADVVESPVRVPVPDEWEAGSSAYASWCNAKQSNFSDLGFLIWGSALC
jgi:hypothetical protein